MRTIFILFIILFSICAGCIAQTNTHYLFSIQIQQKIDSETNPWQLQEYAVLYSKIGNYKSSLILQDSFEQKTRSFRNVPEPPKPDSLYFASFKPVNAVDAITKEAKNYRVVITNEAHYQPQNRVFTKLLLEKLYEGGFRYFCIEDLSADDTAINQRKYPTIRTGYYIDEPEYGNLVRSALSIGYILVPYEFPADNIKDPEQKMKAREAGQSDNIARILATNPNAKILVHSGYGHLNEAVKNNFGLMGALLKMNHHIDPLTVDQQEMLQENHNPYYKWAQVSEPSVFMSGNRFFRDSNENHQVDMVVFFPETKYNKGRPIWINYSHDMNYIFFKMDSSINTYPLMLLAYYRGEDLKTAVPADIIEMNDAQDKKALVLNKGKYIIQIRDIHGIRQEENIEIR